MDHPRWLFDTNPLGQAFRDAYGQFRDLLAAQPPAPDGGISLEVSSEAARRMAEALGAIRLDLTSRTPGRSIGESGEQFEALHYAFAVVVDETLLNEPWPGRAAWGDYLLERRLFKTRSGGERLLERIDAALHAQGRAGRDIAEVYLHCLTLGFAGRLRDQPDGPAELARRRAALFAWLYPDWPDLDAHDFVLTEAPDEHLFRAPPRARGLATRLRTHLLATALLAVPLLASLLMWLALRPLVSDAIGRVAAGGQP